MSSYLVSDLWKMSPVKLSISSVNFFITCWKRKERTDFVRTGLSLAVDFLYRNFLQER